MEERGKKCGAEVEVAREYRMGKEERKRGIEGNRDKWKRGKGGEKKRMTEWSERMRKKRTRGMDGFDGRAA